MGGTEGPTRRVCPNRPGVLRVDPPRPTDLFVSPMHPKLCHTSAQDALSAWEAFPHPCKLLAILRRPPEASPCPQASHSLPPPPPTASMELRKVPVGDGITYIPASLTWQGQSVTHLCSPVPHTEPQTRNPDQKASWCLPSTRHRASTLVSGLTGLSLPRLREWW